MSESAFFLSKEEEILIVDAIRFAELNTSGEIRVHFTPKIQSDDIYKDAVNWFNHLKMYETKDRNSVLILISVENKQFAIIGDEGIHNKVGIDFWNNEKQILIEHFKINKFTLGLIDAIGKIGEKLKEFFPIDINDKNELSDDISYG